MLDSLHTNKRSGENLMSQALTQALLQALTETFEDGDAGLYLDPGYALFETLASVTAEEASRPVGATCASIAAQAEHTRFYLDLLLKRAGGDRSEADWDDIWDNVRGVEAAEWAAIQARLQASYQQVRQLIINTPQWGPQEISGALAALLHSAYHLGEIRQALCTVKRKGE
jgi:hypothetical protein